MVYAACDVWGCLPIIVNRTTTTTTTTLPPITTQESWGKVTSTDVNSVNELKEECDSAENYIIYAMTIITSLIVLTVITATILHRRWQKKKRSEENKLIQVVILMAQRSVLEDKASQIQ